MGCKPSLKDKFFAILAFSAWKTLFVVGRKGIRKKVKGKNIKDGLKRTAVSRP